MKRKDILESKDDPCWKNYKQIGMKKKNGREVPNCVPVDESCDDSEGSYAKNQLHTIRRMADLLEKHINEEDQLPSWVQEKLSSAKGMLVGVTDYIISEYERKIEQERGEEGFAVDDDEETYDGDDFFSIYGLVEDTLEEAEYRGRKVSLNKPMRGDVKKFKVFVKDPKTGNVKKVNFGDPDMRIKKSNPARRKSFRARHHCENPGPKTKARYWSCRKW